MLIFPPPKFRRDRGRENGQAVVPAVSGPVLTAANTFPDDGIAYLTFDRAVNVAGFDGSKVTVNDPQTTGQMFDATGGAEQLSDFQIQLFLNAIGSSTGEEVILNATVGNGIVAVSGGGAWPGVTNLVLPFGE
jgi:hypothetical protein